MSDPTTTPVPAEPDHPNPAEPAEQPDGTPTENPSGATSDDDPASGGAPADPE